MSKNKSAIKWTSTDKSNWSAVVDGESLPARIRSLDTRTFAVYRDGKYLGSESTLALAQARCADGKLSEKNRTMRAWEEAHPDELPPGLRLTDMERVEYWRRHPSARPAPVVRATGGAERGVPRSVGVSSAGYLAGQRAKYDPEDKAAMQVGEPITETFRNAKVAEEVAKRTRTGNKTALIAPLLLREGGCTAAEVLAATGWTAVSMPQQAKAAGLGLRIDKGCKPFRYYGTATKGKGK